MKRSEKDSGFLSPDFVKFRHAASASCSLTCVAKQPELRLGFFREASFLDEDPYLGGVVGFGLTP